MGRSGRIDEWGKGMGMWMLMSVKMLLGDERLLSGAAVIVFLLV